MRKDTGNAFAKHLAEEHPERQGDVAAFKFTVLKTYRKSLYRQVAEAAKIYGSQATIVLFQRQNGTSPALRGWWLQVDHSQPLSYFAPQDSHSQAGLTRLQGTSLSGSK